jgi:hypothetical protein
VTTDKRWILREEGANRARHLSGHASDAISDDNVETVVVTWAGGAA